MRKCKEHKRLPSGSVRTRSLVQQPYLQKRNLGERCQCPTLRKGNQKGHLDIPFSELWIPTQVEHVTVMVRPKQSEAECKSKWRRWKTADDEWEDMSDSKDTHGLDRKRDRTCPLSHQKSREISGLFFPLESWSHRDAVHTYWDLQLPSVQTESIAFLWKNERQDSPCTPWQHYPTWVPESRDFSFSELLSFALPRSWPTNFLWLQLRDSMQQKLFSHRQNKPSKMWKLNTLLVCVNHSGNVNTRGLILFCFLTVLLCCVNIDVSAVLPDSYHTNDMVTGARIWWKWWNMTSVKN